MKPLNKAGFDSEVIAHKGVVLIDFYADWCGPCKMLSPLLEKMSADNVDPVVKFLKVNVDQNQDLSSMFGISSIPTVVFFKDGHYVDKISGFAPKEVYEAAISELKK